MLVIMINNVLSMNSMCLRQWLNMETHKPYLSSCVPISHIKFACIFS